MLRLLRDFILQLRNDIHAVHLCTNLTSFSGQIPANSWSLTSSLRFTNQASAAGIQQPKGGTAWPRCVGSAKALLGPYMCVYVIVGSDAMSVRANGSMSDE